MKIIVYKPIKPKSINWRWLYVLIPLLVLFINYLIYLKFDWYGLIVSIILTIIFGVFCIPIVGILVEERFDKKYWEKP